MLLATLPFRLGAAQEAESTTWQLQQFQKQQRDRAALHRGTAAVDVRTDITARVSRMGSLLDKNELDARETC